jgi:hypothetical protein
MAINNTIPAINEDKINFSIVSSLDKKPDLALLSSCSFPCGTPNTLRHSGFELIEIVGLPD